MALQSCRLGMAVAILETPRFRLQPLSQHRADPLYTIDTSIESL